MQLNIRRMAAIVDEKFEEAGRRSDALRKAAVVAVVQNPFTGRYVEDLSMLVEASRGLGEVMAARLREAFGQGAIQSYGKGGIVGLGGEQEHANALLTTTFAEPFRHVIGEGASAWISSMTKVAAPGAPIDVPMNAVTDVYVRSHYDGMTLALPDTPRADEVALIFCVANRGRLNARVGGLGYADSIPRRPA